MKNFTSQNFKKYTGSPFNISIATKNLIECVLVLEKHNIKGLLVFGTLLGIYRSGDLIPHDSDIDIAISHKDLNKLLGNCIDEFKEQGFEILRYTKNTILSIGKDDNYIDLYIFTQKGNGADMKCCVYTLNNNDFENSTILNFKEKDFPTVNNPESFLENNYGKDWRIPIKGLSANPKKKKRK